MEHWILESRIMNSWILKPDEALNHWASKTMSCWSALERWSNGASDKWSGVLLKKTPNSPYRPPSTTGRDRHTIAATLRISCLRCSSESHSLLTVTSNICALVKKGMIVSLSDWFTQWTLNTSRLKSWWDACLNICISEEVFTKMTC